MIVLGFDTATPATAIGLMRADGTVVQARDDPGPGEHPGHATRLLPLAAELLAASRLGFGDVQRIAVGVGPGTFTGLRIGVATARGLAQSLSLELAGVSSLRALASGVALNDRRGASPLAGEQSETLGTLAVLDARRGEAFAAAYGPAGEELASARALAPERLGDMLSEAAGAGERLERWVGVGDGAVTYRSQLQALGVEVAPDSSPLHQISGERICELGAAAPTARPQEVEPDYRRRPDAEIALERASLAPSGAR